MSEVQNTKRTGHCMKECCFFFYKAVRLQSCIFCDDLGPFLWVWIVGRRVGEQKIYSCWSHKRNQVPNVDVGKYLQYKCISQERESSWGKELACNKGSCSNTSHIPLLHLHAYMLAYEHISQRRWRVEWKDCSWRSGRCVREAVQTGRDETSGG